MAEISEKVIEEICHKHLRFGHVKLICYALPYVDWVPSPERGREPVLRHRHIYFVEIQAMGGHIRTTIHKGLDLPGCQAPIETIELKSLTWREMYKQLADFFNEHKVTAIEAEKTIMQTEWQDKETYDRLFDTATLRFLAR
jgi:hypothetical protein